MGEGRMMEKQFGIVKAGTGKALKHRESNFSLKKVFRLKAAQLGNYRINVEWASGVLGNIMAFKTSKKLIIWLKEDFFFIRS